MLKKKEEKKMVEVRTLFSTLKAQGNQAKGL